MDGIDSLPAEIELRKPIEECTAAELRTAAAAMRAEAQRVEDDAEARADAAREDAEEEADALRDDADAIERLALQREVETDA